ncbi:hypothetical protein DSO57_1031004 [Entomophthora muscae]|uniref:Uncharacterized protein n=1 Tax=Entomophthora muscae TaxID=34485 RepID=A0ACC2SQ77_9FUNG|nr:hypothetical protein DSO57_1031004 [Entomophthora muscae]
MNGMSLSIMHDTYDKVQETVSPYILGIENDGSKKAANVSNVLSLMFGGCFRDFRNSMVPVHVRVTYSDNALRVAVDSTQNGKSFLPCFERLDMKLPTGYYFGFSASSSSPADDHDIFRFSVYELNPAKPDHDMNRPFEKKGKFELDKDELEKINRLKKELESHIEEDEDVDPLTEEAPNFREHGLQETQFRILESLNDLHKKVEVLESKAGISPVTGHDKDSTKLQSDIHTLTLRVKEAAKSINEISDSLKKVTSLLNDMQQSSTRDMESFRSGFSGLSTKIDSILHHGQMERDTVSSKLDSVSSYLWYIFLMASLGGALALGYTAFVAKNTRESKKYI